MSRWTRWRPMVLAAAIGLVGCASEAPREDKGTSISVLVDFSKSFAPFNKQDQRALTAVVAGLCDRAARSWAPPIRVYWSKIETSSVASAPLCAPVEYARKMVNPAGALDLTGLRTSLDGCTSQIMTASRKPDEQSNYTDISGAVALAAERARDTADHRVVVILSDFDEELPPGAVAEHRPLRGARVLLLHRPGLNLRGLTVAGYLKRVEDWKGRLKDTGASEVVAMPVTGATEHRVSQALEPGQAKEGTSVSVVLSMPEPAPAARLRVVSDALTDMASGWDPPVTFSWLAVRDSGLQAVAFPPVEFDPKLIKRPGLLNRKEELKPILGECAEGMSRLRNGGPSSDVFGTLAMDEAATQLEQRHVLILIGDFSQPLPDGRSTLERPLAERAVMLSVAGPPDRTGVQPYLPRLEQWERWLRSRGIATVCRVQLSDVTPGVITRCLAE